MEQTATKIKPKIKLKVQKPKAESLSSELLGSIYDLMVKNREEKILEREKEQNRRKEKQVDDDKQHDEIVAAFGEKAEGKGKKPSLLSRLAGKMPKREGGKKTKKKTKIAEGIGRAIGTAGLFAAASHSGKGGKTTQGPSKTGEVGKDIEIPVGGGLAKTASAVISKEEGLPRGGKAYWDPPNQRKLVSIGYGHQIKPEEYKQGFIQAGDESVPIRGDQGIDTVMTPAQSQKLLELDIPKYVNRAGKPLGDSWQKLDDVQKASLTSYAYNVGSTESLAKAGIKEPINQGDTQGAAQIIRDRGIRTAGGTVNAVLVKRRAKEAAIFAMGETKSPGTATAQEGQKPKTSNVATLSQENKNLKDDVSAEKKTQVAVLNNNNTQIVSQQQSARKPKEKEKSTYQEELFS